MRKNYQPQLVQDFWTINSRTFFLGGILHGREHFARKVNLSELTPKRALSAWCVWWWDILRYLCADAILIFAGEVKQKVQNKRGTDAASAVYITIKAIPGWSTSSSKCMLLFSEALEKCFSNAFFTGNYSPVNKNSPMVFWAPKPLMVTLMKTPNLPSIVVDALTP